MFCGSVVRLDMYKMFLTFKCVNEMHINQVFTVWLTIISRVCVGNETFGTNKSRSIDLAVIIPPNKPKWNKIFLFSKNYR